MTLRDMERQMFEAYKVDEKHAVTPSGQVLVDVDAIFRNPGLMAQHLQILEDLVKVEPHEPK